MRAIIVTTQKNVEKYTAQQSQRMYLFTLRQYS